MADAKVREVQAIFGGTATTFRIEPDPRWMQCFELQFGPPFRLFQTFAAGAWTADQVTGLLSFALVGAPNRALGIVAPQVAAALRKNPPGIYAPLAAKILEAYLFGIAAGEAVFDDNHPFPLEDAA